MSCCSEYDENEQMKKYKNTKVKFYTNWRQLEHDFDCHGHFIV